MIGIEILLRGKLRRSRSPPPRQTGCSLGPSTNNPLVNKGSFVWSHYENSQVQGLRVKGSRAGKLYKEKKPGTIEWRSRQGARKKCVAAVVDVRAIANETKSLHQFINDYPYLPAPPRSNTTTRFRLPDLKPAKGISPLLPSPLHGQASSVPRTPTSLPADNTKLLELNWAYQGPQNAFILSEVFVGSMPPSIEHIQEGFC